jgi:hypothetical protein
MLVRHLRCVLTILIAASSSVGIAAERYQAYNLTAATTFTGVYLAPAGTQQWGPNQALNDKDKTLEASERIVLTGLTGGRYDVKLVDHKGRTCIKHNVDLTSEHSFEIRDGDLASCQ